MEKVVDDKGLWLAYVSNLRFVCGDPQTDGYCSYYCVRATAPQRREAFLRTLGLWEEAK
jgi:hypothetical protein